MFPEKRKIRHKLRDSGASLVSLIVRNLPATQETQVGSLGQEYSLEKGMATHFSILAWRIPGTEELSGLWFIGLQRVGHDFQESL